jgi:hypothetical protein
VHQVAHREEEAFVLFGTEHPLPLVVEQALERPGRLGVALDREQVVKPSQGVCGEGGVVGVDRVLRLGRGAGDAGTQGAKQPQPQPDDPSLSHASPFCAQGAISGPTGEPGSGSRTGFPQHHRRV